MRTFFFSFAQDTCSAQPSKPYSFVFTQKGYRLRKEKSYYLFFCMRSFQCPMRSQYPLLSILLLSLLLKSKILTSLLFLRLEYQTTTKKGYWYLFFELIFVCSARDNGCAQDTCSYLFSEGIPTFEALLVFIKPRKDTCSYLLFLKASKVGIPSEKKKRARIFSWLLFGIPSR